MQQKRKVTIYCPILAAAPEVKKMQELKKRG